MKNLFSIVIPVYNSEKSLSDLYNRIKKVFTEEIKQDFEVILVDDSSTDNSFEIMTKLRAQDKRVKIVQLARNFGQHRALMCGFGYAIGEFVITMDDDLQHPPEEIVKLVDCINENLEIDVVLGRYDLKKHGFFRNFGTTISNHITFLMMKPGQRLQMTSFRIMRKYVVDAILCYETETPIIGHLILATTNRIVNVTVHHDPRKHGRSGYSFNYLKKTFFENIIENSDIPLKCVGYLGFIVFVISLILAIYRLVQYFFVGVTVAGWTSTILLILFFGGVTLFSIGILGSYLLRVLKESKRSPMYIIRKQEGTKDN